MSEWDQIHTYIDSHFNSHVEDIRRFLRQPGISLTGEGVEESTEMLLKYLIKIGATNTKLIEFKDALPFIYGEIQSKQPNTKTLLIYGQWDIVPVDPEQWISPPFAAEIIEGSELGLDPEIGKILVARGAQDQRGPLLAFLKAVESILTVTRDIPVNLIFAIENEEELGSIHLKEFRDLYLPMFQQADAVHYHRMSQDEENRHVIYLGTKGVHHLELTITGGDWGGPIKRDLHSSDDSWVDHPSWRLIWALNSLKDSNGQVLVEGLYDACRSPTPEEKDLVVRLLEDMDEDTVKKRLGIKQFKQGQSLENLLEEYILGPIFNIDGLVSGWTGPGVTTVMPKSATAKLDIRTVPNMRSESILPLLRAHLDKQGFPEVEITGSCHYEAYRTTTKEPIIQAILKATEAMKVQPQVWPTHVTGFPSSVFADRPLNLTFGTSGLGRGGNAHTSDEYVTIEGIKDCEKYSVALLYEFARI